MATAVAVVAGSVISSVAASRSAKKSAQAQQQGIDTATEEQRRQFDITTGQLTAAEEANRKELILGRRRATRTLRGGQEQQFEQLDPFAQAGVSALEQQQFLLGFGDPEQQNQAFSQLETAGSRFSREQAEKRALRTASATGSLGGGGVKAELERLRAGFNAQNFNTRFGQLGQLRTSGQTAATNIGQGALNTGANIANTEFNAAQLIGSGAINTAARQGQFGQATAQNIGNLAVAGGQARASGIEGQNQAFQSGLGGVFTGLSQGGFFSQTPQTGSNQFANFPPQ